MWCSQRTFSFSPCNTLVTTFGRCRHHVISWSSYVSSYFKSFVYCTWLSVLVQLTDVYDKQSLAFGTEADVLWYRPSSLKQLLSLKSHHRHARLVSGATTVGLSMSYDIFWHPSSSLLYMWLRPQLFLWNSSHCCRILEYIGGICDVFIFLLILNMWQ